MSACWSEMRNWHKCGGMALAFAILSSWEYVWLGPWVEGVPSEMVDDISRRLYRLSLAAFLLSFSFFTHHIGTPPILFSTMTLAPPLSSSSSSDRSQYSEIDGHGNDLPLLVPPTDGDRTSSSTHPYQLGIDTNSDPASSVDDTLAPPSVTTGGGVTPRRPQTLAHYRYHDAIPRDDRHAGGIRQPHAPSIPLPNWSQWPGVTFDHYFDFIGAPTLIPNVPMNSTTDTNSDSASSVDDTLAPAGVGIRRDGGTATPARPQAPTRSHLAINHDATPRDDQHTGNGPRQPGVPSILLQSIQPFAFPNLSHTSANSSDVTVDPNFIGAATHAFVNLPMNGPDTHLLDEMLSQTMFWTQADAVYFIDRLLDRRELFLEPLVMVMERRIAAAYPSFPWPMPRDLSNSSTINPTITPFAQPGWASSGHSAHPPSFLLPPGFFPNAPPGAPASSMASATSHCGTEHASHLQTMTAVAQPAGHGQQFLLPPVFLPNAPHSAPSVMQPAGHRQSKRPSNKPPKPGYCNHCGATESSQWRRHPAIPTMRLCNKCGQKARIPRKA
ncbi:hypothetical protein K438DRAFT_2122493 [Mycena galopus ATCC 62051]|nr:hypothetical protein K438DRAFT_2122493 [Mycena galopus ATCC 62051]